MIIPLTKSHPSSLPIKCHPWTHPIMDSLMVRTIWTPVKSILWGAIYEVILWGVILWGDLWGDLCDDLCDDFMGWFYGVIYGVILWGDFMGDLWGWFYGGDLWSSFCSHWIDSLSSWERGEIVTYKSEIWQRSSGIWRRWGLFYQQYIYIWEINGENKFIFMSHFYGCGFLGVIFMCLTKEEEKVCD